MAQATGRQGRGAGGGGQEKGEGWGPQQGHGSEAWEPGMCLQSRPSGHFSPLHLEMQSIWAPGQAPASLPSGLPAHAGPQLTLPALLRPDCGQSGAPGVWGLARQSSQRTGDGPQKADSRGADHARRGEGLPHRPSQPLFSGRWGAEGPPEPCTLPACWSLAVTVNISSQPLCCKRGTVFPPEGVVGTNQWFGAQALRAGLQSAQAARGVGSPPPSFSPAPAPGL